MNYLKATKKHAEQIFLLIQDTIKTVYPEYYPQKVVDFFSELHNKENINNDIKNGHVRILLVNNDLVGTGSFVGNHITRVYVKPEFQKHGYGSYMMECLENEIKSEHETVYLDASLPACQLYEHRGYKTVTHEKHDTQNGVVLIYEIMEKQFHLTPNTDISYDGKFFVPKVNTKNGEVNNQTTFSYHQNGILLWAEYSGGEIEKGHLIGTVAQNGELDFHYQHINRQKEVRIGKCHSIPQILENGKIELSEKWQWLNGDKSEGTSIIIQK